MKKINAVVWYLMPSCNYIVHWHFVPAVEIGMIVVVVLAADVIVIDALQKSCVFGLV